MNERFIKTVTRKLGNSHNLSQTYSSNSNSNSKFDLCCETGSEIFFPCLGAFATKLQQNSEFSLLSLGAFAYRSWVLLINSTNALHTSKTSESREVIHFHDTMV